MDKGQESTASGTGTQAVNINVGMGPMIILALMLGVVILMLVITTMAATRAEAKAERAEDALRVYTAEKRLAGSWMEGTYVACTNAGVRLQPIPAGLK